MSVCRELNTHERIKTVQKQIRIAVINHQILFERSLAFPNDSEVINHMRIMKQLLLSMGRTQLELLYQMNAEVRANEASKDVSRVLSDLLNWPDRDQHGLIKKGRFVANTPRAEVDIDKRVQIVRRRQLAPHFSRSGVKMQSLLKVNHNSSGAPARKESERLKAAAASKSADNSESGSKLATLQVAKEESKFSAEGSRSALPRHTAARSSELKPAVLNAEHDLELDEREKPNPELLTQGNFLAFFDLVHKDEKKTMVVGQRTRKRRSAAGRSNFYNDYFQPKKQSNKQAQAPSAVVELSSQELLDTEDSSLDKPAEPSLPISSAAMVDDSSGPVKMEADESSLKEEMSTPIDGCSSGSETAVSSVEDAATASEELVPTKADNTTNLTEPDSGSCSDTELSKCSSCGTVMTEISSLNVCADCAATPSSPISSIVGASTPSALTSTDCSEVVKRYLEKDISANPK